MNLYHRFRSIRDGTNIFSLRAYFSFCTVLLLVTDQVTGDTKCKPNTEGDKQFNGCICKADGFSVDLRPIFQSGEPPIFKDLPVSGGGKDVSSYSYQPCKNFIEGTSGCQQGVTACQKVDEATQYSIGTEASATFVWDEGRNNYNLTYIGDEDRKTSVMLKCTGDKQKLTVLGENPEQSKLYEFILETKYACPVAVGLSVGSVMCIIFFVGVFLYLVVGFLVLRFGRGARGWEQIPNYEFWLDFPSLVKDGFMFTIRGCKVDSSYSQI